MRPILDFLAQLNPLIQSLTFIALIAYVWKTWAMASATAKAARASEGSIEEMKLSREEQARPRVICYFEHNRAERRFSDFIVKNFGNSTASNVGLVFSPQLHMYGQGMLGEKTFKIMPPGYEWRTVWAEFPINSSSLKRDEFTAHISYDWGNPVRHEAYEVAFDIKSIKGTSSLAQTSVEDALQGIAAAVTQAANARSLEEIATNLKEIAKALQKQAKGRRY